MPASASAPGMGVLFNWDPPLPEFHVEMNRFADGISDFTALFSEIGGLFKQDMAAQFVTEGATSGDAWAPLSTAYAAWKAKHYPGRGIGFASGAGMQSLTGGAGYTEIITPTTAEFGQSDSATSTPDGSYMAFFDKGWSHASDGAHAPARPIMRFTAAWGRTWSAMTARWVRTEAHHAGLLGTGSKTFNQPLSDLSYTDTLPST
jgi:hypothetical protein